MIYISDCLYYKRILGLKLNFVNINTEIWKLLYFFARKKGNKKFLTYGISRDIKERSLMNYYYAIKQELIDNEVYRKVKDCSKNKYELQKYYNVGKLLLEAGIIMVNK